MALKSDQKLSEVFYEVNSPIKNNKILYQVEAPKLCDKILYEVPSPLKKHARFLHGVITPQKLFQNVEIKLDHHEKPPINNINVIHVLHDDDRLLKAVNDASNVHSSKFPRQGLNDSHHSSPHNDINHKSPFKERYKVNNIQKKDLHEMHQSSPFTSMNKVNSFENIHGDIDSLHSSLYSTDLSEIINEIPPIRKKIKLSSV